MMTFILSVHIRTSRCTRIIEQMSNSTISTDKTDGEGAEQNKVKSKTQSMHKLSIEINNNENINKYNE